MGSDGNNETDPVPLRFAGKRVVIADGRDYMRSGVEELFRTEGATIEKRVTPDIDIVIERAEGPTAHEKRAIELNNAGKANIQVVSENELRKTIVPTRQETQALLRGDDAARKRWNRLMPHTGSPGMVDLSGESFRGLDLTGLSAVSLANLDGADLRDTKLERLPPTKNATLDGASINGSMLVAIDCSAKAIHVDTPFSVNVSGSDLTGATMNGFPEERCRYGGARYIKSILRDAAFTNWSFLKGQLEGADLTGADLRAADFSEAGARGATFAGANLAHATFLNADLRGADFSGADLTGASFTGTDLAGAKVDGALLKDATFTNTNLYGVDTSKAKDFALPANAFVVGPCIKKLAQLGTKAKGLDSAIRLDLAQGCVTLTLKVRTPVAGLSTLTDYTWSPEGVPGMKAGSSSVSEWGSKGTSIPTAFEALAGRFLKGRLRPDTLKVAGKGSPISGKDLKDLFLGAWREALGSDAAEAADAAAGKVAPTARALLDELRGDDGVQKWNAYSIGDRTKAGGFRGADLANAKLAGVGFRELDFQKAKFDGADLSGADLERSKLAGASFNRAMLEGAKLGLAVLRGASFRGARLAQADLDGLDLRKVDFTDADLAGAMLEGVIFDETTILPAGFAAPPEMVWKGKGADPRVKAAPAAAPVAYKTLDADAFMASLTARTDASRMEKTLKMLKADRFKLFVEVNDDRLAGVVKSQTDRDLVYACSIAADGAYACCTQNLNPCGGLRGALCKHLLVLVIGLAKGGGIEPGRADGWISAGLGRAPSLDKDAMARILLRYKGAEAGEVDWRPMETVPEDYYAM